MSEKYTLVHEGLSQWINSPNNGGECCQTWADTVDELNRLLDRIKRLEEAGDALYENSDPTKWDLPEANARKLKEQEAWRKSKEDKL